MNGRIREGVYALVGVGIMAVVLLLAWVLFSIYGLADAIRETQQTGSPILKAIADQQDDIEAGTDASVATNKQVLDCTQPTGECYRESQKRSADVVGSINEISLYAAACADQSGVQTVEEIQSCVIARLSKSHH